MKAALTRFADLCSNIRPAKCRNFILNLLPCLVHASQREEDIVQEVLATSVPVSCKLDWHVIHAHNILMLKVFSASNQCLQLLI